ncbi:MAG TPA: LysR family transcriptional regulator [Alphaproteobacteria bacterium]|nr:LysR family transcriptional regulator [Alphaproteobacteria bacterium]
MNRFPDIDTLSLRIFIALSETGNFTQAAERINRTQSAISQQIKKLEEDIGKILFDRSQRNIKLTSDGELFFGYAQKILEVRQELFSRFKEPEVQGEIKFGTPEDFATLYLPEVLSAFAASHPMVMLNVECDLTMHLIDKFNRGDYDLVVIKQLKVNEKNKGTTMWIEHLDWVSSARVNLDNKNKFLPLVLSPAPCVYRKRALEALDKAGIKWRIVYTSPSFAGTVAAVKAGLGITVLPRKMIPDSLSGIRKKNLPDLHETYITLLQKKSASPAVNSFAEYIISHLG